MESQQESEVNFNTKGVLNNFLDDECYDKVDFRHTYLFQVDQKQQQQCHSLNTIKMSLNRPTRITSPVLIIHLNLTLLINIFTI